MKKESEKLGAVAVCVALFFVTTVAARENSSAAGVAFDIDAPTLDKALMQFIQQSGMQLVLPFDSAVNEPARKVIGKYTPAAALDELLAGTALRYEFANARTIAIQAAKGKVRLADSVVSGTETADSGHSTAKETNGSKADLSSVSPENGEGPQSPKAVPEILVKGSRIMNVDVVRTEDDVQPYTILTSKQIAQSGASNVEEFLRQQLTMNTVSSSNSQVYQSINGTTSSIDLRGLGVSETLILVNGRRSASVNSLSGSTAALSQPDINGIPLSAIERIEILPSSASAIYGGSAMGGVVNFVLKRDFQGGALAYSFDNPENGHAPIRTTNGSYGFSLGQGKTQVLIGGQYSESDPLRIGDRSDLLEQNISRIQRNSSEFLYSPSRVILGAAPNIASSTTFGIVPEGTPGATCFGSICVAEQQSNLVLKNGVELGSPITSVSKGTSPGTDLSSQLLSNAGSYNLDLSPGSGPRGRQTPFGATPRTKSVFSTVRQSVSDRVQLFGEFSFNENLGRAADNPFASSSYFVSTDAPTNPFLQDVLVNFPSVATSSVTSSSQTRTATIGMIAQLKKGWNAEFDYTWSKNAYDYQRSIVDITTFQDALNSGAVNPFVDTLEHPLDLSGFLGSESFSSYTTLNDVAMRVSGEIGSLPAGSPVVTVGLEHRKEGSGDAAFTQSYPASPGLSDTILFFGRSQSTNSVYAEGLVPLVSSRNSIAGVYSLNAQVALRSEHYTVHNGTPFVDVAFPELGPPQGIRGENRYTSTNPTIGIAFQPTSEWTLRASFATGFLPPTAAQLLANPTVCESCAQVFDPLVGGTYLVNLVGGGNPSLQPQTSRSWNFGAIWQPRDSIFEGVRANLEYYKITQPNYIVAPLPQQVVGDPGLSSRVTRDPASGLITVINTSYANATEYRTAGWDLKLHYTRPTAWGKFGFQAIGTLIQHDLRQVAIDSPFLEYAGFPNDGGEGKLKANAALTWEGIAWSMGWMSTYYSNYMQTATAGSPTAIQIPAALDQYTAAQGATSIPSQTVHSIFASYSFGSTRGGFAASMLSGVVLQVGVTNLFNARPPLDVYFGPYFYSNYGSPRLRSYQLSVVKKVGG